ncbi:MAG: hypothetical protein HEQ21_05270 [Blastomonas sp.]|uniref:hypothetical protein n=1 Tax=Blastomonas sp. TaxID=1909299 RepID=UPI002583521C|nr:hypothetical protein [Blastomonas sp.]MCO5792209.1 hypothetical protein [Blastomonas sp.]
MAYEWITAPSALAYVSDGSDEVRAQRSICERAHSGLIATKADRVIYDGREERDALLGKGFWWAEGYEALVQDWRTGDFATWIDKKIEVKAYGVSFDFPALSEMVPVDKQAAALRNISVIGDENWLSADALVMALHAIRPGHATAALAEVCRLGQLGARAMRATCHSVKAGHRILKWQAIEWDVPLWFWRDFTDAGRAKYEWTLGRVQGEGIRGGGLQRVQLQGLHFHRSGLVNLGLKAPPHSDDLEPQAKRGRRSQYDWPAASLAIFGLIYRGDLKPASQADIERALIAHLSDANNSPSESTVRPFAKKIWDEFSKA